MVVVRRDKERYSWRWLFFVVPLATLIVLLSIWEPADSVRMMTLAREEYPKILQLHHTLVGGDYPKLRQLGQTPLSDTIRPAVNDDAWTTNLYARLDRIRERCGPLCTINDMDGLEKYTVRQPSNGFLRQLNVPGVDCDTLMLDEELDAADPVIPRNPPPELMPFFTMNGLVEYRNHTYSNQTYMGTTAGIPVWTRESIDKIIHQVQARLGRSPIATYGWQPNIFVESLKKHIDFTGKRVLVIGTEFPWLEAVALWLGAAHVTTLEYGTIDSQHPNISAYTPQQFRTMWEEKGADFALYDIVVSFSSLEHAGMGRYGDALNPWADILSVARARCVTKPGGYLGLALPSKQGDFIQFNTFRSYGKYRWPVMAANWEHVDGEDHIAQPKKRHVPFIFRKPEQETSTSSSTTTMSELKA